MQGEDAAEETRLHVSVSRGERHSNQAPVAAGRDATSSNGAPDSHGVGEGPVPQPAELLQGRSGTSGVTDSHRSGWPKSQAATLEVSGSAQDGDLIRSRVVRVEVLESTGDVLAGLRGNRNHRVYCIEVEDNHNF